MYHANRHLHFIGIGGVGMAGIAEVLLNLGYRVSGSDIKENNLTRRLESLGAEIFIGHSENNVKESIHYVIRSSAIDFKNPEIVKARELHLPIISRAEMLAELMRAKYGIAVGGAHGKTTTTSMIAHLLKNLGVDPTVIIGGRLLGQETGANVGKGDFLVAEADESDGSFCYLKPSISIVTNIDREHLDHYGSFAAIESAFSTFISAVPFYGAVIACFDDPVVAKLVEGSKRRYISYGLCSTFDLSASNIDINATGTHYTLKLKGQDFAEVFLPMPGVHLALNSLAALSVCYELNLDLKKAVDSFRTFPGVSRRSEVLAEVDGVCFMDDYGHHPKEIAETLKAIRKSRIANSIDSSKLYVFFQPHRYTRTRDLFSEFVNCFSDSDFLYVGDIYSAGELEIEGVCSENLAQAILNTTSEYSSDFINSFLEIKDKLAPGDVVLTLGAGTVGGLGQKLVELMRN